MRYGMNRIITNASDTYEEVLKERGVPRIRQFATPKLRHLNPKQVRQLNRVTHMWRVGDRYYKLAYKHYGDSRFWWVIAWYNRKPTESHVTLGSIIYIPTPLEEVLRFLGI
tara:strand:+ start:145 stop:477 length:333 start_codon:yes stop_codon:yes gene_type:complete